jgi:YHS domain-containing protein
MIRTIVYLVFAVIVLSILRAFIGFAMKGLAALFSGSGSANQTGAADNPRSVPSGGVLRRDPVCGTYVSENASLKLTSGDAVYHFCSPECRERFQTTKARS